MGVAAERAPDGPCVVVNAARVVLGLVEAGAAGDDPHQRVEQVMSEGPSTFRPDVDAADMTEHIQPDRPDPVLVTTSDGRLVGLADPQAVLDAADQGES